MSDAAPRWRRSFRALNVAQLLGAFNDNLFKGTILLLVGSEAAGGLLAENDAFTLFGASPKATVNAAFAVPFIVLGSLAGALADRYGKPALIGRLKWTEVALMVAGTFFLWNGSSAGLLVLLLLMACQSAFFGPNKYGVLPEMLPGPELSRANAVIQATTYAGIIAGIWLAGELLGRFGEQFWWIGCVCVGVAVLGALAARGVAPLPPAQPTRKLTEFPVAAFVANVRRVLPDPELVIALLLGALFLLVGGLLVLAVVSYGDFLGFAVEETGRLSGVMALGIGFGSWMSGRVSGDRVRPGLVPLGACGVAVFLGLLWIPGLHWGVVAALLFLAGGAAGFFVVPVRAIIQMRPPADRKGEVIGLAQILDFTAVLLSAVVFHLLEQEAGLSARAQMLTIGLLTGVGAVGLCAFSAMYLPRALRLTRRGPDPD